MHAVPEFVSGIPEEDRPLADRVLGVTPLVARDEDLADYLATSAVEVFDYVVLAGVVLKETVLGTRSTLEILGPGDVLAPPLTSIRQVDSRAVSRYMAHGEVKLAPLDERFRQAARKWPGLSDVLHDLLGRQTHRASMHMAMLHLTRVEDRIEALFADLAERFGRMTSDGVLIDIPLTHEVIGRLVGSRRPTVSLAMQSLAADGILSRTDDDRWKIVSASLSD